MFAVNGILFNHESPRRGETFVTRKITRAVARIKAGLEDYVYMGNLDAVRDWGYAPEYVEGMWRMLQADEPDDYVLATGGNFTVRDFVEHRVRARRPRLGEARPFDERYLRPTEVDALIGDAAQGRATSSAGRPTVHTAELARLMVDADIEALEHEGKPWIDQPTLDWWPTARQPPMSDGVHARARSTATRPFYVAGHRGLVGSAIWRTLEAEGFTDLVGRTSAELDLRDRDAVFDFFAEQQADVRGPRGGQGRRDPGQQHLPGRLPQRQPPIQVNVLDAALEHESSGCSSSARRASTRSLAPQPIREDCLLTGHLEPTNDAYAIAKIAGILHVQAVRRQYGLPWISAMPTNLYGPGDNFSPKGSHVLPALIRRYDEAARDGARRR